ncbi:MAG: hypothetical protein R2849_03780 [Thermomicrobiales bacterium]
MPWSSTTWIRGEAAIDDIDAVVADPLDSGGEEVAATTVVAPLVDRDADGADALDAVVAGVGDEQFATESSGEGCQGVIEAEWYRSPEFEIPAADGVPFMELVCGGVDDPEASNRIDHDILEVGRSGNGRRR